MTMTTTTFDRGDAWSYRATYEKVGNLVVDEFHRLVHRNGMTAI